MDTLYFATSNQEKMLIAQTVCSKFNINVERASIDIDEIQGEDPVIIIQDKVRRAYEGLTKPVVVSDDSWDIPALNGFPGPYMKSINKWFNFDDFLRLMEGISDRSIILHQLDDTFLTSTSSKIMPISKIDNHTFGPSQTTFQVLMQAFNQYLKYSRRLTLRSRVGDTNACYDFVLSLFMLSPGMYRMCNVSSPCKRISFNPYYCGLQYQGCTDILIF